MNIKKQKKTLEIIKNIEKSEYKFRIWNLYLILKMDILNIELSKTYKKIVHFIEL